MCADILARLLQDSPVRILILNGSGVVRHFQQMTHVSLKVEEKPDWTLPRTYGGGVVGFAYTGIVETLAGIGLSRPLVILGFNHNIQSSFGVTTRAIHAIRTWVAEFALNEQE
jgi:hypothetical protein